MEDGAKVLGLRSQKDGLALKEMEKTVRETPEEGRPDVPF